ncbi:E3 ubiquitin/ISG15 ligase TRIM25-like isoform X2 [Gadus macrocephalus]|uniref:E3 ubiquitin/ISG15 ligase TRIM25-like isoform X2 n=1 Tax=Gadus macrocephalus TaxID=80720 RepID=UPI0028CB9513|nr:E3 ubiquitin/ISG15 ligase TRIM25-like isoform X2 [Gadus macrocephalus]
MAQQKSLLDRDRYCCSICLDPLCNPGTLACGHSYCLDCIRQHWDNQALKGVYSCPECRKTFKTRPAVVKTTILANVMEDLKRTQLQDTPPEHCYDGPEDVGCDVCTGRKMKAIKTCLVCQVSYCEDHLQSHYLVAGLKRHKLVEPAADLQDNICPRHNEVMNIFCRQDRQAICHLCFLDEHRSHDTVSAEAERNERQKELSGYQRATQARVKEVEQDLEVLQQEMVSINRFADEAVRRADEMFVDLIRSVERQRSEVTAETRTEQEAGLKRVRDLRKNLEQELVQMKGSGADLDRLSQTQSHITFLQKYPWNYSIRRSTARPTRDAPVEVLPSEQLHTRAQLLTYSCELSIDPSTTHLLLTPGDRGVTQRGGTAGGCRSKESLTGRHYWEVKWRAGFVTINVGYKDSSWDHQGFGKDRQSWALIIQPNIVQFQHDRIPIRIPGPPPSRVGVYLDYRAGTLCFYSISDTMTLLHKVKTTFTKPLYAGLWLDGLWLVGLRTGGTAEFCYLRNL